MHIFGIHRVDRLLLCIWFPHHMAYLSLQMVQGPREQDMPSYPSIRVVNFRLLPDRQFTGKLPVKKILTGTKSVK